MNAFREVRPNTQSNLSVAVWDLHSTNHLRGDSGEYLDFADKTPASKVQSDRNIGLKLNFFAVVRAFDGIIKKK